MTSRSKVALFLIVFLDTFGYALLFPQLFFEPDFHTLPFPLSESTFHLMVGAMLISYPLAQSFGAPFFGKLSDQYGRKKILAFTIIGTMVADIFCALSIHAHSFLFLLLSQLVSGFFAANLAICMAMLTDVLGTKRERGKAFCLISAILGFSWMLSFFLVVFFTKEGVHYHPALPFWFFALCSAISLLILFFALPETAPPPLSLQQKEPPKSHRYLRQLYFILLFFSLGLFISLQWISPLSILQFRTSLHTLLLTFLALGSMWVFSSLFLGGSCCSHLCLWKVNLWTLFSLGLFLFFAAVARYYTYFIISYSLVIISAAVVWGILLTLISMAAKPGEEGEVMGIIQSMFAVSKLLAPPLGGMIAGLSLHLLLYTCAFLILISFLLLLINVIRRSNKDALIQH